MHYAKIHFKDYAADTSHLSLVEHGVYFQMMRLYYTTEKPLPLDRCRVARLIGCRTSEERIAVDEVIEEFFVEEADGWHQKRMDEEIAKYQDRAEKNRECGKLGGRPKKPTDNPNGSQTKPKDNPQITLTTNHKPLTNTKPLAPSDSANRSTPKVSWNEAGFQIPEAVKTGFKTAYPAVDIAAEIAKAHAWVLANPANRKSQWGRFLNSWLERAQNKAPRVQPPAANQFQGVL